MKLSNSIVAVPTRTKMSSSHYRLRIAATEADVRAAQLLRFIVFNLELREGLDDSFDTCLDTDRFDAACEHLVVEEISTGEIVGTYRLQTGMRARECHGYYSEQEFDFKPYESLRSELLELGRACIRSGHRNFAVLNLLWKGISAYARDHGARYLVGCSSLTSEDPAEGATVYQILQPRLVAPEFRTRPVPAYECRQTSVADEAQVISDLLGEAGIAGTLALPKPRDTPKIPKLLATYLALGAKICGPPALDRAFKTIDFLTLMDLREVSLRWDGFGKSAR